MAEPQGPARRIVTVLEARVPQEQWDALQHLYGASASVLPPQMVRTMLVQSTSDRTLWRAVSIWRSQEALGEYRRTVQVPEGIVMFRSVGAEPTLSLFEVEVEAEAP